MVPLIWGNPLIVVPCQLFCQTAHLEGQGNLVSSFRREIPRVILWVIGVINLVVLTKSP